MKKLVIYGQSESTKEVLVPNDFTPVSVREFIGKEGEETYSKDYLIDTDSEQECD